MDEKLEYIIVTRHKSTVEWLSKRGINGKVYKHLNNIGEFKNKIIIGNVPFWIASKASLVIAIQFRNCPPNTRGGNLTINQMDSYGAYLQAYSVKQNDGIEQIISIVNNRE